MTLPEIIETYGYWAILGGTLVEGETILVLGGFAAHQGYLDLPWVILTAFVGTLCSDQFFFFLGRKYSSKILAGHPTWQSRVNRAYKLLARFQTSLILIFRFLLGFRSVIPFVIGTTPIPARRFLFLNMAGAIIWSVVVGTAGYLSGSALEVMIGNLKEHELKVLLAIVTLGFLLWTIYFWRRRRRN